MLFYFTNANAKLRATSGLRFVTPRYCLKFAPAESLIQICVTLTSPGKRPDHEAIFDKALQPDAKMKQSYTRAEARSILDSSTTNACTCMCKYVDRKWFGNDTSCVEVSSCSTRGESEESIVGR